MSTIKLIGYLTDVFQVETFPNFAKRVFWLKEPDTERYPNHWELELHTHDINEIGKYEIGDRLECEVEVRGRKYINRRKEESIGLSLKCNGIKLLYRPDTKAAEAAGRFTPKKSVSKDDGHNKPPELPL